jgi:hypothetical protein
VLFVHSKQRDGTSHNSDTQSRREAVDGKRNPVKLVSAVVKRKNAVVTGNLFEANIPPTTISPLQITTLMIMTCKIVKAPTDIPTIMESPRCSNARGRLFGPSPTSGQYSQGPGTQRKTLPSTATWQTDGNDR